MRNMIEHVVNDNHSVVMQMLSYLLYEHKFLFLCQQSINIKNLIKKISFFDLFTSWSKRSTSTDKIFGVYVFNIRKVGSTTGLTISESR